MGRNALCTVLTGAWLGWLLLDERGSVDRARCWCSLSACWAGGAFATVGSVAGAFLGLRVSVGGAGWVGTHGVPRWLLAGSARGTTRNAVVSIGLVAGAPCRRATPEERVGSSVVSLVRSWVSEGLEPAPDGSERMVFRVGGDRKSTRLNSSHLHQSRMPSSA